MKGFQMRSANVLWEGKRRKREEEEGKRSHDRIHQSHLKLQELQNKVDMLILSQQQADEIWLAGSYTLCRRQPTGRPRLRGGGGQGSGRKKKPAPKAEDPDVSRPEASPAPAASPGSAASMAASTPASEPRPEAASSVLPGVPKALDFGTSPAKAPKLQLTGVAS